MAQQGRQMRVGTREDFAILSVKLVLLANGNRYEVDFEIVKLCFHLKFCPVQILTFFDTHSSIDYGCDDRRFWLSAHDCQAPTPTSQNLDLEQQMRVF